MDLSQLPENFYIATSSQLLLAPLPKLIYAVLLKAALQKDLAVQSNGGIPLHWGTIGASGDSSEYAAYPEKGRLVLASDLPDVFAAKVDMTGQPGLTVRLNRPKFESTTYTQASRRIAPNATISTVPIGITSEQNNITLERFAGPYDQANSRVAPFPIDRLLAQAGVHSLTSIAGSQLRYDFDATLDGFVRTLLDTGTAIYPTGMSAVNDAAAANQYPMDLNLLARCQEDMDNANLPTFGDGCRLLVISPTQKRQLSEDPVYRFEAHEHKEYSSLFPKYIGQVKKFHVFESTSLTTTANSNSVPVHRAHAIAPGALGVAMGEAPRVAKASDTNYDEQAKLIWIAYMGLQLMDNRFVRVLATA